jgi:ankyrin repeat protein
MKSKNLPQEIITKIKSWEGFEDFDGTDIEFCHINRGTALMRAIDIVNIDARNFDFDVLESLVQAGANVNCIHKSIHTDDFSYTPLIFACIYDCKLIVEFLLKAGADVNLALENGETAISELNTASKDYIDILEMLINAGADVNICGGHALQSAIEEGNCEAIKTLVNAGAKVDISGPDDGRTAFMYLLDRYTGGDEGAMFLLFCKYIGNVNVQDNDGKRLIFYALNTNYGIGDFYLLALDRLLFNENVDVNLTDKNQNTALNTLLLEIEEEASCTTGKLNDSVKYQIESLLIAGSNVEIRNADGDSPKIIAKRIGIKDIQFLIENGVDLNNSEDRKIIAKKITYEDMVFLCEHTSNRRIISKRISYEEIQSLIKNSINKEIREEKIPLSLSLMGETPLFTASRRGSTKKVKWLIKKGAYVNTKCKSYENDLSLAIGGKRGAKPRLHTALMVANDIDTVKALIRAGADINVQASDGNTALMLYTKYNWLEGVEELFAAGADANLTNKWFETAYIIAKKKRNSTKFINLLQKNTARKVVPSILSPLFFLFKSEYDY